MTGLRLAVLSGVLLFALEGGHATPVAAQSTGAEKQADTLTVEAAVRRVLDESATIRAP